MILPIAFLSAGMTLAASAPQTLLGCPRHPATAQGALATEHAWVRALEMRDSRALSCILAREFADTNWRGEVVSRGTVLARLPSRPASTLELSHLSVFLEGRFAIVRGTNSQAGPAGRNMGSVRFTDVFVYRGGAWRAVSAQETLIASPKAR
jgi:hypothetical protein